MCTPNTMWRRPAVLWSTYEEQRTTSTLSMAVKRPNPPPLPRSRRRWRQGRPRLGDWLGRGRPAIAIAALEFFDAIGVDQDFPADPIPFKLTCVKKVANLLVTYAERSSCFTNGKGPATT